MRAPALAPTLYRPAAQSTGQHRHAGESRYPRLPTDGTPQNVGTGFRRHDGLAGPFLRRAVIPAILSLAPILLAPVAVWAQQSPVKKPTPVVQPQGQTHAQKPAAPPIAAPAKPEPPTVAAVAAPVVRPPAKKPVDGDKADAPQLPRFQSLRSNEVNLRAGPGTRYRIDWVYKRSDLPVQVVREFEHWRAIRDADGIEGWVNQATLNSRRNFVVKGGDATLRDDPNDKASPVATLKPGVIGRIRTCPKDSAWCHVTVAGHGGYLKRSQFWGTLPNEEIAP